MAATATTPPLIACPECDLLHQITPLTGEGGKAHCSRCGAKLYQKDPSALDRTLAFYLAALICFIFANLYPFLSLKIGARIETVHLTNSIWTLQQHGMPLLGLLVLLTSLLFPLLMMIGHLYLLLPRKWGITAPGSGWIFRLLHHITPWSMVSIFVLASLVAVVKLLDIAEIIPGIGAAAFVLMMLFTAAAEASFDSHLIWPFRTSVTQPRPLQSGHSSAAANGLICCSYCKLLAPLSALEHHPPCAHCGGQLHLRKPESIQRTWSLLAAATLLLIPANLYPIMTVIRFGQGEPSTILGGVIHLAAAGMWGLSLIIFFASILIPGLKLITFSSILITIQFRKAQYPVDRTRLCRLATLVGAWSMTDIFVIALLSALMKMGVVATVEPNIGALFFAAVVVTTMMAAESFDSRLIWDTLPTP
ncbi:MAG: PqiA/YebS family transporter subunit [Mariprofundales bacterium]|nr:PqiA/YebS family transporter subunit [Mariprofundales bacterium]